MSYAKETKICVYIDHNLYCRVDSIEDALWVAEYLLKQPRRTDRKHNITITPPMYSGDSENL